MCVMDGQPDFPLRKGFASRCCYGLLVNPDAREIVNASESVHKKRLNVYRCIEQLRPRRDLLFLGWQRREYIVNAMRHYTQAPRKPLRCIFFRGYIL